MGKPLLLVGLCVALALVLGLPMMTRTASANAGDMDHLFRGDCSYTHSNDGDPVMYPPPGAGHTHEFFGNDTTDQDSTVESLQADSPYEGDTSQLQCDRAANKSAYWVPRVSWGGEEAVPHRSGVYYATRTGLNPRRTETTPFGFKMVANSKATIAQNPQLEGSHAKVYFHCDAQKSAHEAEEPSMRTPPDWCGNDPNYGVPTLGITLKFPECWDGGPFVQAGGASMRHSFVNNAGERRCPASHPTHIPQITMLVDYKLPQRDGPLAVLGHKDAGGVPEALPHTYMHADYFNSEDLEKLVQDCIRNGNGGLERCQH